MLLAFWPPPKPTFLEPGCLRHLQKQLYTGQAPPLHSHLSPKHIGTNAHVHTHGTPGRRLRYRPPGGGGALAPGKFCPAPSCQGGEVRVSGRARWAEAESPPVSQGASPLPPPLPSPSLPAEPPREGTRGWPRPGWEPRSPRTGRPRHSPAGVPGTARCDGAPEEVAWELAGAGERREGEGYRRGGGGGRGRTAAREQAGARRRPPGWERRPGGGGGGPRGGRQARGCGHGAQPPAHAEPPPPPLLQSASISGRGCRGTGCSAEPAPPRGLPARRSRGGAPRPARPRWGPPGPGRHVRAIRWHGRGAWVGLGRGGPGALYSEAQPSALGEDEESGADRQELSLQAVGPPASVGAVLAGPPDLPGLQPSGRERWAGGELRLALRMNVCWVAAGLAHSCSPFSETTPAASEEAQSPLDISSRIQTLQDSLLTGAWVAGELWSSLILWLQTVLHSGSFPILPPFHVSQS